MPRKLQVDRAARLEPVRMGAIEARARRSELVRWARHVDCAELLWAESVARTAEALRERWGVGRGVAFEYALRARRVEEVPGGER